MIGSSRESEETWIRVAKRVFGNRPGRAVASINTISGRGRLSQSTQDAIRWTGDLTEEQARGLEALFRMGASAWTTIGYAAGAQQVANGLETVQFLARPYGQNQGFRLYDSSSGTIRLVLRDPKSPKQE